MKIISAGFPKTGTKSASEALRNVLSEHILSTIYDTNFLKTTIRILGYSVCDVLESAHCGVVKIWLDYIKGERPIEDVLEAYEKHGFG